ncbi:MAG: hypothetical protein LBC18_11660, partial [Opitutaceae bacterium]|nr:hypothetical protein [Opitutaceae bacterium]
PRCARHPRLNADAPPGLKSLFKGQVKNKNPSGKQDARPTSQSGKRDARPASQKPPRELFNDFMLFFIFQSAINISRIDPFGLFTIRAILQGTLTTQKVSFLTCPL